MGRNREKMLPAVQTTALVIHSNPKLSPEDLYYQLEILWKNGYTAGMRSKSKEAIKKDGELPL